MDDAAMYWMGTGNSITAMKLAVSSATNLDFNAAINLGISCGINMDITSIGLMNINNAAMKTTSLGLNHIINLASLHVTASTHWITGKPILLN